MPGVFDQGNSNVAQGWRELGANPGPSDLFVCVVACPENASVECKGNNGGDVRSVDCPLGGMFCVMSADVGMMERIAGGFCVHCDGVGRILVLPVLDHGVDGINEAMLWNGVEETNEVVIGGVESNVGWCISKVAVEVTPKLRYRELTWVLGVKVL